MIMIIFSGAVPLGIEKVLTQIGIYLPSYWAMNAQSATVDLNKLSFADKAKYVDAWSHSTSNLQSALWHQVLFICVLALSTYLAVRLRRSR